MSNHNLNGSGQHAGMDLAQAISIVEEAMSHEKSSRKLYYDCEAFASKLLDRAVDSFSDGDAKNALPLLRIAKDAKLYSDRAKWIWETAQGNVDAAMRIMVAISVAPNPPTETNQ